MTVIYSIAGLGIMAALISAIASQRLAAYAGAAAATDAKADPDAVPAAHSDRGG